MVNFQGKEHITIKPFRLMFILCDTGKIPISTVLDFMRHLNNKYVLYDKSPSKWRGFSFHETIVIFFYIRFVCHP